MDRIGIRGAATTERADWEGAPARSPSPERATLHVVHCPDASRVDTRFELDSVADALIGRDVCRGLVLDDRRLSRLHSRVVWDAARQGHCLGDADSSNGTYVNGQRVRSARLSHGDVVRCGDTLLVFETERPMQAIIERAERFARTSMALLVYGETGTGKEVISRLVHDQSGVPGDFVAINCATLSRELAAAELFGHVKGAFSGATQGRTGLFAAADGGTLLLDEIGDLPLDVQPALLRALEEGAVRPVGSDATRPIDVRVIAATHLDLDALADQGRFRSDLLGRLAQVRLELPPLRRRRSEILGLARRLADERGFSLSLTPDAAETLLSWDYPFNVRELKALVSALQCRGGGSVDRAALAEVDPRLLSRPFAGRDAEPPSPRAGADRRTRLQEELSKHRGNVSKVAKALGSDRAQIYRWMKSLGVSAEAFRN